MNIHRDSSTYTKQIRNALEDLVEPKPIARWIVGIDLGTTNSAVACVDTESKAVRVIPLQLEQRRTLESIDSLATLPSFHYQLTESEATSISGEWIERGIKSSYIVGSAARDRGSQVPGRLIASAKSWLSQRGTRRSQPILPWQSDEVVEKISPVEASSRYLRHIRKCWDALHPQYALADCDVILTIPASFDEVARELTVEAARQAGIEKLVLIEEPQAAFYAWLEGLRSTKQSSTQSSNPSAKNSDSHREFEDWFQTIRDGQTVLVCDIGGGTTDLTLIRVRGRREVPKGDALPIKLDKAILDDDPESLHQLHRVAVGEHLLIGGDNFDAAIAADVELRFVGGTSSNSHSQKLNANQWEQLRNLCRDAKEKLLGETSVDEYSITLLGSGRKVIESSRSHTINRNEVIKTILDGFFPIVPFEIRPTENVTTGLQEIGLDYATEPAITKHLASFLWTHRWSGRDESDRSEMTELEAAKPDWILFNGGVLESILIKKRLLEQLSAWFQGLPSVQELEANRLNLAVAIGASYFGMARRGLGVRIQANLARTYYLQISQSPAKVLCIVPSDASPLDRYLIDGTELLLEANRPIQLPVWYSSTRLIDRVGEISDLDEQAMRALPPVVTVLKGTTSNRQAVHRVKLETLPTEIGTLEITAVAEHDRWRLAFDLRSTTQTDIAAHRGELESRGINSEFEVAKCETMIREAFQSEDPVLAKSLIRNLAQAIELPKGEWSPSLLRRMWSTALEVDSSFRSHAAKESRWLNLIGFCLRPGYGFAADDWRVAQTWRTVYGKIKNVSNANEASILWRRIAGGFTAGQQQALYQELQHSLRSIFQGEGSQTKNLQAAEESVRLAGSLELLSIKQKCELGEAALRATRKKKLSSMIPSLVWTIGRIGNRVLAYGPLDLVLPNRLVSDWLKQLMVMNAASQSPVQRAVMMMSRRTQDRHRDIDEQVRQEVLAYFRDTNAPPRYTELVQELRQLTVEEEAVVSGESLPLGIALANKLTV